MVVRIPIDWNSFLWVNWAIFNEIQKIHTQTQSTKCFRVSIHRECEMNDVFIEMGIFHRKNVTMHKRYQAQMNIAPSTYRTIR